MHMCVCAMHNTIVVVMIIITIIITIIEFATVPEKGELPRERRALGKNAT